MQANASDTPRALGGLFTNHLRKLNILNHELSRACRRCEQHARAGDYIGHALQEERTADEFE